MKSHGIVLLAAIAFASISSTQTVARAEVKASPRPAHVIVVVEENKSFGQIIGNAEAPYINMLGKRGALFTNAHGVTHPSLPNYLALFAGVTNDNGDGCPATGFSPTAANLGSELIAARDTFAGYSESLPGTGSTVCAAGTYARKHAPWVAFSNVPASANRPLSALPHNWDRLETVAFVIPNVDDDMHDGSIRAGDMWLHDHFARLLHWADAHRSLVILTWDEGYDDPNTIPTILYGPMVRPGRYAQRITHYNVLRTIEDLYGLSPTGKAKNVAALAGCWR